MRKDWKNPELKNLAVGCTNEDGCPNEAKDFTLLPDVEHGDGKFGCTWNANNIQITIGGGLCTHPNWTDKGLAALRWPCKKAPQQTS